MRVREPWKRRIEEAVQRSHVYRTINRHLGTYSTTSRATRSMWILSSSLIISRVMKPLVSFSPREKTISGELWTRPFNSSPLPVIIMRVRATIWWIVNKLEKVGRWTSGYRYIAVIFYRSIAILLNCWYICQSFVHKRKTVIIHINDIY